MKKQIIAMMIAVAAAASVFTTADASWLSKVLNSQPSSSGSSTSTSSSTVKRGHHWSKVYETENYTIYIDTNSMKATGEAQNREVSGWFKREYTPEGSAWLGNNSSGKVKPDVITYSVYQATYDTYKSYFSMPWYYYDVNGHLIFKANWASSLGDMYDEVGFGDYVPESKNEQIKDILFNAVGWNY